MCKECKFEEWLDTIDDMKDNITYEFALDYICSVEKWIRDNNHITPGHKIALENIINSNKEEF